MPEKREKSETIAKIFFAGAEALTKDLIEIKENEFQRAAVLILDFEKIERAEFSDEKLREIKNFPVPIIAAVKGNVGKRALSLIDASHLCVVSDSAKFTLLSGKEIDASEALKKGLINKIAPPAEVETEAFLTAEKIARLAPLAARAALEAVTRGSEMTLEDGLKLETELFCRMFSTEDMREGTSAFFEKREAVFRGK